jgi:predicted nucleic acid-binding protein
MIIYLVEHHPIFADQIKRKLVLLDKEVKLVISPLVRLEVLVKPRREGNHALLFRYEQFLTALQFLSMPAEVYEIALSLRVEYNLKTPDALHLATAQFHRCQQFWTNDDRLNRASSLSINILKNH